MSRLIALILALALVPGALVTAGTAGATAVPAPAASPPPGDQYFTAAQLAGGLLTEAELPAGYAVAGGSAGSVTDFDIYGSNLCTGGLPDRLWGPVTSASRTFRRAAGGTVSVVVTATGADRARDIVAYAAAAPAKCPAVTRDGLRTTYTRLPLPDLGAPSAGLVATTRFSKHEMLPVVRRTVAVAHGDVSAVFQQSGDGADVRASFLEIVRASAAKLEKIDEPPAVAQLRRALIDV
ncbi:MAG TPA: hypothetical protein VGB74_17800, partial [Actinoplanes sp.]